MRVYVEIPRIVHAHTFINDHPEYAPVGRQVSIAFDHVLHALVELKVDWVTNFGSIGTGRDPVPAGYDRIITYHTHDPYRINLKMGYLPGFFYLDRTGYSGWSEAATVTRSDITRISKTCANRFFSLFSDQYQTSRESKYSQKENVPFNVEGKYIFVPLQTPKDAVTALYWYDPYYMVTRGIPLLAKLLPHHIVVKPHPLDKSRKVRQELSILQTRRNHRVTITDASIHDILPGAEAVMTFNSGVGFEALLYEKPVFNFGRSDYGIAGHPIPDEEEMKKIPEWIDQFGDEDRQFIRKFVYWFLNQFQCLNGVQESYTQRLRQILTSPQPPFPGKLPS
jgi:hypothetical protein